MSSDDYSIKDLKAIAASLCYLEAESRRVGLQEVSWIIKKAIADMDDFLKGKNIEKKLYYYRILDSDLYKIFTLLDKFSKQHKFDLRALIKSVEAYENMEGNSRDFYAL